MAKFTRFDSRNKKQDRKKILSLEKDLRIHEEKKKNGKFRWNRWVNPDFKDENTETSPG